MIGPIFITMISFGSVYQMKILDQSNFEEKKKIWIIDH